MKSLVSIIIPVYNAQKYIKETIESALNQTYKNIEIIVVDDGSIDETAAIVESFQNPRIVYIYQENQGQSSARNTGIRKAKGTYIAFLDADDLFLPRKIEEQVSFLENHPDCGLCYCDNYHFFSNQPDKLFHFSVKTYSGLIFDKLLEENFINPLSVLLKKEILDEYGEFKDGWRRCDEQYLWLKLAFNKVRFCYLDKVLAYYRVHKDSLSAEGLYLKETAEKFLELLDLIESWLKSEERKKYPFERLRKSWRKKLLVGNLISKKNIFSKFLLFLYKLRLKSKFKVIK